MHTREGATMEVLDTPEAARSSRAGEPGIIGLLDEAIANQGMLERLAADLVGTLYRMGAQVSTADLKQLLGIPGATDVELCEVLRARILRTDGASCGCGGSED
jgi:hypothetical protein